MDNVYINFSHLLDNKVTLVFLIISYIIYTILAFLRLNNDIHKERTYLELIHELEKGRKITLIDILMNGILTGFCFIGILCVIFLINEKITNFWLMLLYSILSLLPIILYSLFFLNRILKNYFRGNIVIGKAMQGKQFSEIINKTEENLCDFCGINPKENNSNYCKSCNHDNLS